MNTSERKIIKALNKLNVDTRYISLYENKIYINNLKFSKFSRKKEEEFHELFSDIEVVRSMLFQKICIKVSRTVKNQIKPRDILYIENNNTPKSILLNIVLEAYKRKYGIKITDNPDNAKTVSFKSMNDIVSGYINLMINGEKITNTLSKDSIYPLLHVDNRWIDDWISTTDFNYKKEDNDNCIVEREVIDFLDTKIPNVCESIIQSVEYLDTVNN